MGVEMIWALRDLHGEFARAEHGAIRVLVDNKAAIAQMSRESTELCVRPTNAHNSTARTLSRAVLFGTITCP
jgi:hypothetical protein